MLILFKVDSKFGLKCWLLNCNKINGIKTFYRRSRRSKKVTSLLDGLPECTNRVMVITSPQLWSNKYLLSPHNCVTHGDRECSPHRWLWTIDLCGVKMPVTDLNFTTSGVNTQHNITISIYYLVLIHGFMKSQLQKTDTSRAVTTACSTLSPLYGKAAVPNPTRGSFIPPHSLTTSDWSPPPMPFSIILPSLSHTLLALATPSSIYRWIS